MSYKQAKGAIPWQEGDEPPEDVIRRIRGDCSKLEGELANITHKYKVLRDSYYELRDDSAAEMREALEDLLEHGGMGGYPAAKACDKAKDALSAAPKRGRVVWEGNGRIREEAGYHEDERSSYHYTAYYVDPLKITDFDSFLVGTDLDAKCKWLYNDLLVTVTVREAEQPIRPSTEPSCYRPDIDTGEDAKRRDEQEKYPDDEELFTGIGPGGREAE